MNYHPVVYLDHNAQPLLVFARAPRSGKYHAVQADNTIRLVQLDTLRGLREAQYHGEAYTPRRCASYWLNHSQREITKRAKFVLRALVKRKQEQTS